MTDQQETMQLVMTCCADEREAKKIAHLLVKEKLAACVNILPATSIYAWQGEIVEEEERLLLIKTRTGLANRLQQRIQQLHSYEVPEIVHLDTYSVEQTYLAWLIQETADG